MCQQIHGKRHVSETVSYVLKNAPCEVMLLSVPMSSERAARVVKVVIVGCSRLGARLAGTFWIATATL